MTTVKVTFSNFPGLPNNVVEKKDITDRKTIRVLVKECVDVISERYKIEKVLFSKSIFDKIIFTNSEDKIGTIKKSNEAYIDVTFPPNLFIFTVSNQDQYKLIILTEDDKLNFITTNLKTTFPLTNSSNIPLPIDVKLSEIRQLLTKNLHLSSVVDNSATSSDSPVGTLYIVQLPHHFQGRESIFKIGRTSKSIEKRVTNYPKGTIVLFTLACDQKLLKNTEVELIELFRKKFKQRSELGAEYFEGDLVTMMLLFLSHTPRIY